MVRSPISEFWSSQPAIAVPVWHTTGACAIQMCVSMCLKTGSLCPPGLTANYVFTNHLHWIIIVAICHSFVYQSCCSLYAEAMAVDSGSAGQIVLHVIDFSAETSSLDIIFHLVQNLLVTPKLQLETIFAIGHSLSWRFRKYLNASGGDSGPCVKQTRRSELKSDSNARVSRVWDNGVINITVVHGSILYGTMTSINWGLRP